MRLSSRNCFEDVAAARSEGFEQADLAGALGDGDEHDVHDAYAADAERHGADDSKEDIEAVLNCMISAESATVSQLGTALSSLGSKWWRPASTARTACNALRWSSGALGWKTMLSGSR